MVKLPAKFDDICKTAKSVLEDDYKSKGYQVESKAKTNLDGAILTTTVDLAKKGDVFTPAKLSCKFPKPFGIVGFAIDKLEYESEGKMKLEASMKKDLHCVDGLVVDCKSDCKDASKATVGFAYTGIKDAFVKFETKPLDLIDFKAECLYGVGSVALGVALSGTDIGKASFACNFTQGDFFASLIAKKKFTEFTPHVYFKPSKDLLLAATLSTGKETTYAFGAQGTVSKGILAKAKVDSKMDAHASCKFDVCAGMKATLGGSYNYGSGTSSMGAKLVIE